MMSLHEQRIMQGGEASLLCHKVCLLEDIAVAGTLVYAVGPQTMDHGVVVDFLTLAVERSVGGAPRPALDAAPRPPGQPHGCFPPAPRSSSCHRVLTGP